MSVSTYISIYYYFLLIIVLSVQLYGMEKFCSYRPLIKNFAASFIIFLLVFFHFTFRPIDVAFADTVTYARFFKDPDLCFERTNDYGFSLLNYICSQYLSLTQFFGLLTLLYILPLFWTFKNKFPKHYFWMIVMFVTSLSFWGYGVNGLRNGIATSLILIGFLNYGNLKTMVMLFILAISFHLSVLLPVVIFLLALFVKRPSYFFCIWLSSIFLSLFFGSTIENFIGTVNLFHGDNRMEGYIASKGLYDDKFSSTGFRYDFLIYSFIPIFLGMYYYFKKKFREKLYVTLLNTYMGANAFWILLINIPYSNRFAYLSWFLMPVLLIYPLLKKNMFVNQSTKIVLLLLFNYLFTFFMYLK